jgi:hypothetical protein
MKNRFRTVALAVRMVTLQFAGLGLVVIGLCPAAQAAPPPAPEIDAGSLVSGLALLSGGVLIVTNRFRRK